MSRNLQNFCEHKLGREACKVSNFCWWAKPQGHASTITNHLQSFLFCPFGLGDLQKISVGSLRLKVTPNGSRIFQFSVFSSSFRFSEVHCLIARRMSHLSSRSVILVQYCAMLHTFSVLTFQFCSLCFQIAFSLVHHENLQVSPPERNKFSISVECRQPDYGLFFLIVSRITSLDRPSKPPGCQADPAPHRSTCCSKGLSFGG